MSRMAVGVWLAWAAVMGLYGFAEHETRSWITDAAIGLVVALIPLYFTDKALKKEKK